MQPCTKQPAQWTCDWKDMWYNYNITEATMQYWERYYYEKRYDFDDTRFFGRFAGVGSDILLYG